MLVSRGCAPALGACIEASTGRAVRYYEEVRYLVCRQVQEDGQTPVWSTGGDNWASPGLARTLGFAAVARGAYVIPRREPPLNEAKTGTRTA